MARTKSKKYRGLRTHGRGKKGGRGAGLRGGKGNAGLHKHKFTYMIKYMPDHFGRRGFKNHGSDNRKEKVINVGQLEEIFPNKKEIDLYKEGFEKLLGKGMVRSKLRIVVPEASEIAIGKIKNAGGEVIIKE